MIAIRVEAPADVPAIRGVLRAAFPDDEHAIVDALRARGALAVSLVADDAGEVIGHVALSPVRIDGADLGWYGLGPIAVRPDRQRRGVGRALLDAAIAALAARGAAGCVLVGDPAFYGKVGFRADPRLTYAGAPAAVFLVLPLAGAVPTGAVTYDAAFGA